MVDFLMCGQCQREFPLQHITTFIQHKRKNCEQYVETSGDFYTRQLNCSSCPQIFSTAWALLKHIEFKHQLKLFLEKNPSLSLTLTAPVEHSDGKSLPQPQKQIPEHGAIDNSKNIFHQKLNIGNSLAKPDQTNNVDGKIQICGVDIIPNVDRLEVFGIENNTKKPAQTLLDNSVLVACDIPSVSREKNAIILPQPDENVSTCNMRGVQSSNNSLINERPVSNAPYSTIIIPLDEHTYSETPVAKVDKQPNKVSKMKEKPCMQSNNFSEGDSQMGQTSNSDVEDIQCCDSLECGVSVVPGTHETMKKCCASIVPKKRKRHMETKHLSYTFSKALRRRTFAQRCKMNRNSDISEPSRTIYIDVGTTACPTTTAGDSVTLSPSVIMGQAADGAKRESQNKAEYSVPGASVSVSNGLTSKVSTVTTNNNKGAVRNKGSLILKPGSVLTIPISSPFILPHYKTALFSQPVAVKTSESSASSKAHVSTTNVVQTSHTQSTDCVPVVLKNIVNQPKTVVPSVPITSIPGTSQNNSSPPWTVDADETSDDTGDALYIDQPNEVAESSDTPFGKVKKRRYPTSRPFKCDQCEHCFNQRIHLKKHQSKHTGIKPYKCQQCDYSTVERSHLKVHIRIHTGEKPFKCTYCEYATAQNSTLKIHLKRHHGGKMLECNTCKKKFTEKETLQKHETIDHNNTAANSVPIFSEGTVICEPIPQLDSSGNENIGA